MRSGETVGRPRQARSRRRRALAVAASLVAHALILLIMLPPAAETPKTYDPPAVTVRLVDSPRLFAAALTPAPAKAPPAKAKAKHKPKPKPARTKPHKTRPTPVKTTSAHKAIARHTLARRAASPLTAADDPGDEMGETAAQVELSAGEVAGAASAGSGPPGGVCDMPRRVQEALRRDPMVRPAVARFAGKAIRVWDGDWVWMQGDDGKGLTAVRQAMMWEIAAAPKACRAEPVHGLVLISTGPARLAVGSGVWRWSDLLVPHPGASRR